MTRKRIGTIGLYVLLIVVVILISVIVITPFYWMIYTSFKDTWQLFVWPIQPIPVHPTLENYSFLFLRSPIINWFANSSAVAVASVISTLVLDSLTGYVFAKMRFFGSEKLFLLIISCLLIPVQVQIIPLFFIFQRLHLLNSWAALILPQIASPFGVLMMTQFMKSIPSDLIKAARIDGASEVRIWARVVLPLSKPALVAVAIIKFLWSWNSFLWPLIATTSDQYRTLPVGIALWLTAGTGAGSGMSMPTPWGVVMAGGVLGCIPVLVIYLVLQKYFVRGIQMTGLKF